MITRDPMTGRFVAPTNGKPVGNAVQLIHQLVQNEILSRSHLIRGTLDSRRNINQECGYPDTTELDSEEYRDLYEREGVATRTVEVFPKESWKTTPTVFEEEDGDEKTEFEIAWKDLGNSLQMGEESFYQADEGNPVWEYLLRADILSGIGSYGVLLLGVDDGEALENPIEKTDNKLLFIRVFDESLADITKYEQDKKNPRFGQPTNYHVSFTDPTRESQSGQGAPQSSLNVHWTRIVHIADNRGSSEVFGVPRMRPVINNILNLRKMYGGSAEMYWRGAFPGLSIESHPQLLGEVDVDTTSLKDEMEQYMNGLQRYMKTVGFHVNSLAPQVSDPTPQINVQLEAVCIRLGIPKRIFTGSERGELASNQDDSTWNERVAERRSNYITPKIIVPFINRLIGIGVLPKPKQYNVTWEDLGRLSDGEKATIAVQSTEAMAKYVQGGVEALLVPFDYLTRVLSFTPEEAEAILNSAEEHMVDVKEEEIEDFERTQETFAKFSDSGGSNDNSNK